MITVTVPPVLVPGTGLSCRNSFTMPELVHNRDTRDILSAGTGSLLLYQGVSVHDSLSGFANRTQLYFSFLCFD